jgi:hypothetical protein
VCEKVSVHAEQLAGLPQTLLAGSEESLLDPKRCEQSGDPGEWDVREIGDLASKDLCR